MNEILTADTALGLSATGWTAVTALGALLTAAVALAAVLAAGLTARSQLKEAGRLRKEARRLREEETRPYVGVSVESNPAEMIVLDIVIRNFGRTPALDTRIKILPRLESTKEDPAHPLADVKLLNEPIPLLAPGREIRLLLDHIPDRRGTDFPSRYKAEVSYRNSAGKTWEESHALDLGIESSGKFVNIYGAHDIAKALQGIEKTLKGRTR